MHLPCIYQCLRRLKRDRERSREREYNLRHSPSCKEHVITIGRALSVHLICWCQHDAPMTDLHPLHSHRCLQSSRHALCWCPSCCQFERQNVHQVMLAHHHHNNHPLFTFKSFSLWGTCCPAWDPTRPVHPCVVQGPTPGLGPAADGKVTAVRFPAATEVRPQAATRPSGGAGAPENAYPKFRPHSL